MTIYDEVLAERLRAHAKHGQDGDGMESDVIDVFKALTIIGEEYGEAQTAALEESPPSELRGELIQLAAMACALADGVGRRIAGTNRAAGPTSLPAGQMDRIMSGSGAWINPAEVTALLTPQPAPEPTPDILITEPLRAGTRVRTGRTTGGKLWERQGQGIGAVLSGQAGIWRNATGGALSWSDLQRQYGPLTLVSVPLGTSEPVYRGAARSGPTVTPQPATEPTPGEPLTVLVRDEVAELLRTEIPGVNPATLAKLGRATGPAGAEPAGSRYGFEGSGGEDVGPVFVAQWDGECGRPDCAGTSVAAGDELRMVDTVAWHAYCAEALR